MNIAIKTLLTIVAILTLGSFFPVSAAKALVIDLDVANNASPTNSPWATVTIDELVNGDIRFIVALTTSTDLEKGQASIEQFGFNSEDIDLDLLSFTDISNGFSVNIKGSTMSIFGGFDVAIRGENGLGFDPLSFTIVAPGDSIDTYTSALTNKGFLFSAKLAKGAPMAFIATSAIPIPPALYLFGSGLIGLIGISRKNKSA